MGKRTKRRVTTIFALPSCIFVCSGFTLCLGLAWTRFFSSSYLYVNLQLLAEDKDFDIDAAFENAFRKFSGITRKIYYDGPVDGLSKVCVML